MEATLRKFEDRFADYTSLYNRETNTPDYIEICFLTAEYLYEIFKIEESERVTGSIEELISQLGESVVVYFEYLMKRGESHALCFIVEGNEVVVCQSLGSTFRATHESIPKARFTELLRNVLIDNDPLTHVGHAPIKKLTTIKVASRKAASPALLYEITPADESWLRAARLVYINDCWPDGDDFLSKEYQTDRQPNVYTLLLHLQSTY